jgi:hypothetical protein
MAQDPVYLVGNIVDISMRSDKAHQRYLYPAVHTNLGLRETRALSLDRASVWLIICAERAVREMGTARHITWMRRSEHHKRSSTNATDQRDHDDTDQPDFPTSVDIRCGWRLYQWRRRWYKHRLLRRQRRAARRSVRHRLSTDATETVAWRNGRPTRGHENLWVQCSWMSFPLFCACQYSLFY